MVESPEEQNIRSARKNAGSALPPCCGTGCTVCVLDYPELFLSEEPTPQDSEMLAMLQAFETAQTAIDGPDSEI
jgi:hypothetical protein